MSLQEQSQPALTIGLFGAFRLVSATHSIAPIRSRKGQWLLALLLLRNGQEAARDWLAGVLWPDTEESQALAYLRREIYLLKQALGEAEARIQSPTPRTLRFDTSDTLVDALAFDAALKRGDVPSLEAAVSLYRGPLLEGCDAEWGLAERRAREEALLQALQTLAEHAL